MFALQRGQALGAIPGELVPKGFKFPSREEYVAGIVKATNAVKPLASVPTGSPGDILHPPVKAQLAALQATLEGTTGLTMSQLSSVASNVYNLASATDTVTVMKAVKELLNGALEIVTALLKTAGVASAATSAIPVLGDMMSTFLGMGISVLESQARIRAAGEACQQMVEKNANFQCSRRVEEAVAIPSRAAGPTPADLFRPVSYAYAKGSDLLPLTFASVYVQLCGEETQGFVKGTRSRISPQTQRRMWELIKGIFACVEDPLDLPIGTDGGRSLFPILQDIVLNEWQAKRIDHTILRNASRTIGQRFFWYTRCTHLIEGEWGGGAMPIGATNCAHRGVDLATPFSDSIINYRNALIYEFYDSVAGKWNINPRSGTGVVSPKKGLVVASGLSFIALAGKPPPPAPVLTTGHKALLAAAGLSGGYLAFLGARKLGKRR